ncbi:MAG: cyclophilin-like fold protein [Eggerthellaceae bacterium]
MRKSTALGLLALGLSATLCACSGAAEVTLPDSGASTADPPASAASDDRPQASSGEGDSPSADSAPRIVRATFADRAVLIELADNPTADDLYSRLPFELRFSDYNNTEKIAYPVEPFDLEGSPDACDPEPGDLALYAPWGNVSLFYEDFRYSEGLVPMGKTVEGLEFLSEMSEGELVVFERVE